MRLIAENISHQFGPTPVLKDVGLSLDLGEVVAVVGPSGCGKSTLLGILGGLIRPSSGQVFLESADGEVLPELPLTYVFQDFALLPWKTVYDNIRFVLPRSLDNADGIIRDVLARTGLAEFASALPKQLSGGMRQRVGIARALAARPAVLLMDEPLSALDSQTRELMMDDLRALLDGKDFGVVYVTHNLVEAVKLADRVIVLSKRPGRIHETLSIEVSREDRLAPSFAEEASRIERDLWAMIRAGASEADRELS